MDALSSQTVELVAMFMIGVFAGVCITIIVADWMHRS